MHKLVMACATSCFWTRWRPQWWANSDACATTSSRVCSRWSLNVFANVRDDDTVAAKVDAELLRNMIRMKSKKMQENNNVVVYHIKNIKTHFFSSSSWYLYFRVSNQAARLFWHKWHKQRHAATQIEIRPFAREHESAHAKFPMTLMWVQARS